MPRLSSHLLLVKLVVKNIKKSKGGDPVESTADKALKRIMKVGEAMEKKIDEDLDDAPAKAPAAVPIGEKMKQ